MSAKKVYAQIQEVIDRLIQSGLSVRQFTPSFKVGPKGAVSIGDLQGGATSIALKNVDYRTIYTDLERNDSYHVKFPDGGLLLIQYEFGPNEELTKHRLGFFPPADLPTIEEAPHLYESDDLYGDILINQIVRFPIRFDFDPTNAKDVSHPHSHLTFGQFENCRIPVSHPILPNAFCRFILMNFYHRSYLKNRNLLDKRPKGGRSFEFESCITWSEKRIPHFVVS